MKAKKVFISILTILTIISAVCTGVLFSGGNKEAVAASNRASDGIAAASDRTSEAVLASDRVSDNISAAPGFASDDVSASKQAFTEERTTSADGELPDDPNGGGDGKPATGNQEFRLDATARKVTGLSCYDVTISAYSGNKDISGYVRMSIINSSDDSIAYDTKVNLPEKTEKSFVLRIPNDGYFNLDFEVSIAILDDKMNELYSIRMKDLFQKAEEEAVYIGILSSDFNKLSYLAIDGWELDRMKERYEVKLVELNANNIVDELDKLSYLVIEDFDTSTLDKNTIKQIQMFVEDGGIMILGTGKNEDKTLKGFGKDYIDAEIIGHQVQQIYVYTLDNMCDMMCSMVSYGNSYSYNSYSIPGMHKKVGRGVILLSEISFLDPDFYNISGIDQLMYNAYVDTYNNSGFYYNNQYYGNTSESVKKYFESIEGFKKISVGGLKLIVIIYVLVIGPVLYLILKKSNKREYFWIAIPVVTVIFMAVIMVYGGRYRLSTKNISNVTIASADGRGSRKTYMTIFSSKSGNISVDLSDSINGIGTVFKEYGNYNGRNITDYHVKYDGGNTRISHDGDGNFDKGYFVGMSENRDVGNLSLKYSSGWSVGLSGSLENNTIYDFDYVLIKRGSDLVVVKGLKAGDMLAVSSNIVYSGYYYWRDDNFEIPERYKESKRVDYRKLAALFLALDDLGSRSDDVIIGLTSDYESFAKGDVNELSYGCIYSIGTIE